VTVFWHPGDPHEAIIMTPEFYTERNVFMRRTPSRRKPPAGYDENSPFKLIQNFLGNYYLVHGSADDNVHVTKKQACGS